MRKYEVPQLCTAPSVPVAVEVVRPMHPRHLHLRLTVLYRVSLDKAEGSNSSEADAIATNRPP